MSKLVVLQSRKQNAAMLYIAVLLTGSCGLAYEYTISKVASDLLGNSSRQWAMIIGVMMFFMGLGANYQKILREHMLFAWFVLLELLLSLFGGLSPLLLLWTYAYWQSYYVLWQYLLIAAIGFLIGLEIPIITRINEGFTPELKVNIGRTLQMDYIGALGGALLWSYALLPYLPLSQAAVIIGFANLVVTWLFMAYFYRQLRWRKLLWVANIGISSLLLWAFVKGPQWSLRSEQGLYQDPIVFSKTTKYQHLVMTESAHLRPAYFQQAWPYQSEYRLYINGHLQFSSLDEFIYHENLVHPALALFREQTGRGAKRVLILGGGDGLALREVLKYASIQTVILCDFDTDMLRLAAEQPILRRLNQNSLRGSPSNGKVTIISTDSKLAKTEEQSYRATAYLNSKSPEAKKSSAGKIRAKRVLLRDIDAVRYIGQATGSFDVIIADFPDPNNEVLSKLYSLPFYHNVKRKLADGGVFVQQSTSPAYAYKAFWSVGRTMMAAGLEALPYSDFVPSFGEWGWWLAQVATDGKRSIWQLYEAAKLHNVGLRYLNDAIMQANIVLPASFMAMYGDSLVLLPHYASQKIVQYLVDSKRFPKSLTNNLNKVDTGLLYLHWVTTYTQSKVYQYYLEASWY